jgi:membrane-associated phospholipid phosphatase
MAAGAAALLGGLVVAVSWRDPLPGETGLLELVVVTDDGWRAVASAVAGATDLLPLAVVTGVLVAGLLLRGRARAAAQVAAASAAVWLVNPLLKSLVARPRPDLADLPEHLSEYAFPSGHAANTAVLLGGLAVVVLGSPGSLRRRVAWGVAALAFLVVAASQLALGRHYPSDLLAGWLLAAAVLALLPTRRP